MTGQSATAPGAAQSIHPLVSVLLALHEEGFSALPADRLDGADIDAALATVTGIILITGY